jgi:hypothetical protein
MSNVAMGRDELLDEARAACRDLVDDETFSLFELWALMELGWNKALDAIDHPDPAKRATERADLDFWVTRARDALDASGGALVDRLADGWVPPAAQENLALHPEMLADAMSDRPAWRADCSSPPASTSFQMPPGRLGRGREGLEARPL